MPLSYGLNDVIVDHKECQTIAFTWEPAKPTAVFIKINAISTEFAERKHGGEKGAPFRLTIETYETGGQTRPLNVASCQVKVFKPRGSDRKHKADLEKLARRSLQERLAFEPPHEVTVFKESVMDFSLEDDRQDSVGSECSDDGDTTKSDTSRQQSQEQESPIEIAPNSNLGSILVNDVISEPSSRPNSPISQTVSKLSATSTPDEVRSWMHENRFYSLRNTFENYSGDDLLRLTRPEMIELAGLSTGIRFFNTLHAKTSTPALTLYVSDHPKKSFRAILLQTLSREELTGQLSEIFTSSKLEIIKICCIGNAGVRVFLTDSVLTNVLKNEGTYLVQFEKLSDANCYKAILNEFDAKRGVFVSNVFAH